MRQQERLVNRLRFWNKKIALLLLLLLPALAAAAAPGSEADPLVTRSWVEQYVEKQADALAKQLGKLEGEMDSLLVVRLWMGRAYMEIDGERQELEAAPFVTPAGRSFVPLRALGEAIGADFKWDNASKRVTYLRGGKTVELRIGSAYIVVNGKVSAIDAPPQLVNNRVFVPIRVVGENLGFAVNWLSAEKSAVITFGE